MLIDGAKIDIPFEKDITIPRPEKDIVLHVVAVPYEDEFKDKCPQPMPPVLKNLKGEVVERDFDDKNYRQKVEDWTRLRFDFLVVKSITNVEWETVLSEDPETWPNWKKECLAQGFTDPEVMRIINEVIAVHNPTAELIDKMRSDFLASARRKTEVDGSSQNTEQESTSSSEPVND